MIIEGLFDPIFSLLQFIIGIFPSMVSIAIPSEIYSIIDYLFEMSAYFVPLSDIGIMFGIFISVTNFHFIYSIIMRIWDALPLT